MSFVEIKPEKLNENSFQLIGKEWMLITAGDENKTNTMTASWGGLGVMWGKNVAYVVIRPQRYTKQFVDDKETFSLSFFGDQMRKELGYLGTVSGRNEDKINNAKLTTSFYKETPFFEEARLVLFCKKMMAQPLNEECFLDTSIAATWYAEKDYHTLYIAEITDVLIKEN